MGKGVIILILALLNERADDEEQQSKDHPGDDYQRGRALATRQSYKAVQELLEDKLVR